MSDTKSKSKTLKISQIVAENDTQSRVTTDETIVAEYAEQMKLGANFPPIEVVEDRRGKYYLTDGYHRLAAARLLGLALIGAVVRPGDLAEARWLACAANKAHGLRRTNADKRKAARAALMARPDLTDNVLGAHVGVAGSMIGGYRAELLAAGVIEQTETRVGMDGRKIDTERSRLARIKAVATRKAKAPQAKYSHCLACRGTGMVKK